MITPFSKSWSSRRSIAVSTGPDVGNPTPAAIALTTPHVQVLAVFRQQLAGAVVVSCGEMSPGKPKLTTSGNDRFLRCPIERKVGGVTSHESQDRVAANGGWRTAIQLARVGRHSSCIGCHEPDRVTLGSQCAIRIQ